jgi:hypothetical protein
VVRTDGTDGDQGVVERRVEHGRHLLDQRIGSCGADALRGIGRLAQNVLCLRGRRSYAPGDDAMPHSRSLDFFRENLSRGLCLRFGVPTPRFQIGIPSHSVQLRACDPSGRPRVRGNKVLDKCARTRVPRPRKPANRMGRK